VDAVHLHRAVLPPAALSADPVLTGGPRAARRRPCRHPDWRGPRDSHAAAQPLQLPDRVQVFRRRAGSGARGDGPGLDQRALLTGDAGASAGARLMRSRRAAIWARIILIVAGLGVAGFLFAFPLYWLVAHSLEGKAG